MGLSETISVCPICQNMIDLEKLTITEDLLRWLAELHQNGILQSWLFYSRTIHEQAMKGTTAQVVAENVKLFEDRFMNLTREELNRFTDQLSQISMALTERAAVPILKGTEAEMGLLDNLEEVCPEDEISRLGGRGQPDIIAKPKYKNAETGQTIIIEIKDTQSWSSKFVRQLEEYMTQYNTPFGILATRDLPAKAETKGFSIECDKYGIILITRLEFGSLAYQILRKILIAFHLEGKETLDYRALFKDEEIIGLLTECKDYTKNVRKIRKFLRDAEKELTEMQNALDERIDTVIHKISVFQL